MEQVRVYWQFVQLCILGQEDAGEDATRNRQLLSFLVHLSGGTHDMLFSRFQKLIEM